MALVTNDFLAGIMTNFRAIFMKALADNALSMADYTRLATVFNSTTDKETYAWLGAAPSMQEWVDKRRLNGLRNFDYTLTNKHYEATIEVDRDTFEDDKYGLITPRVQSLAKAALRYFNERVFSQLDDGAATKGYDTDYYFFADTRVIGSSGNIDNLLAGDYSASEAEIRAGINAAVEKMAGFQDDWGKPMNLMPDTIVCSPYMYMLIRQALLPGVSGVVRPESELIKAVIANPWIDLNKYDWYILCTTEEVKPIIFQLRKAPEFVALDDPKGEHAFKNKTFLYGVDTRFQVGYGDPRTAIKMDDNT